MNRQQKRMMQKQGQLGEDGAPAAARRGPQNPPARRAPDANRPGAARRFANYMRDVRAELGKVLWPRRPEVVNYSMVVFTALVVLALLIFGLNLVFAKGVLFLFKS